MATAGPRGDGDTAVRAEARVPDLAEGAAAPIRVLLADDHTLVRKGIRRIVVEAPGMEVVADVATGTDAVVAALRLRPDVVLMDVEMPGMSGIEATHQIIEADPSIRVLMLTNYEGDDFLFQALQAGAAGYVLKSADVDELLNAVRIVNTGETYVDGRMASKLVGDYLGRIPSGNGGDRYGTLTPRERELLPVLADGESNADIARLLRLSPFTVRTHRQRVMQKLNLHTRTELLKYALKRGLLSLDH